MYRNFVKVPFSYNVYNSIVPPWTIEHWKDITYPGVKQNAYMVSSTGKIYSKLTNKILSQQFINSGYKVVPLSTTEGVTSKFLVHRLVAYAFCDPPENFMDMQVNHIDSDGGKTKNRDVNLEWVDPKTNMKHALEKDLVPIGERQGGARLTNEKVKRICELLEQGYKYRDILIDIGMDINNRNNYDLIGNIKRGKAWRHISKDYNLAEHTGKLYTNSQIHEICRLMTKYNTNAEVYKEFTGKDYNLSNEDCRKFESFCRGMRKYGNFNEIFSQYDICQFND